MGDPACWLHMVCACCGLVADDLDEDRLCRACREGGRGSPARPGQPGDHRAPDHHRDHHTPPGPAAATDVEGEGEGGVGEVRVTPSVGAVAGAVSTVVFTAVHDLGISDIWATLPVMLVAGVACGASLAWAYAILAPSQTTAGWLRFNALHLAMFGLLGLASVVVFEPVTTMAAVIAANEPPGELIGRALPMTVAFTFVAALLVVVVHGRRWRHFGVALAAIAVLVLFLGLNVSVIGLVDVPSSSAYLVAELFGLVALLDIVYAVAAILLAGHGDRRTPHPR